MTSLHMKSEFDVGGGTAAATATADCRFQHRHEG